MTAGAPLDATAAKLLVQASSLHDIGKVGIPDAVLCKPGKLTPAERNIMQKHAAIGGECLLAIKKVMGEDDFLTTACDVAFSHHERWDGTGYPNGLKGEGIPLSGRIVAWLMCTMPDSQRVYKAPCHTVRRCESVAEGSGSQFDPAVVAAFIRAQDSFSKVASKATRPFADAA